MDQSLIIAILGKKLSIVGIIILIMLISLVGMMVLIGLERLGGYCLNISYAQILS